MLALGVAAGTAEAGAQFVPEAAARPVDTNFNFEFFGTDVLPWATGERYGKVQDSESEAAKALQARMLKAKSSVDVAAYGVQDQRWVLDTLKTLVGRGVRVGVTVDQLAGQLGQWLPANFTYPDTAKLPGSIGKAALTPDQGPEGQVRASTIMHNKFVVVDRKAVWLGSANLSSTCLGAEYNANTAILIESPELARIYADEYRQMHDERLFSIYKAPRADRAPLRYKDGTEVRVYFSPQDAALTGAILPFVAKATKTLDIGMFYLTDQAVADEIVAAHERGVKVRVIYDGLAAAHPSSLHKHLRKHGIDLRVENWGGKMHMKAAVADGKHVIMGSMNWSDSGDTQNDENTLVVRYNAALGAQAKAYFESLWQTLDPASGSDPRAEGPDSINSCADGVDNDHDGLTDAADSGC